MKTLACVAATLLLLALDWAAWHDILKANEPDYTLEYGMLAFSVVPFAALLSVVLRRKRRAAL
jgi:hypothetical protein